MRDSTNKDYILLLAKKLDGLCDVARIWWGPLSEGLHDHHFVTSEIDPGVWISKICIAITYVYDILMFVRKKNTIDNTTTPLQTGITLTNEGELDPTSSLKSSSALTDEGAIYKHIGSKSNKTMNNKHWNELISISYKELLRL